MTQEFSIKIDPFDLPQEAIPTRGRLFYAVPEHPKPENFPGNQWCHLILNSVIQRWNSHIVIPESFWPGFEPEPWVDEIGDDRHQRFTLIDQFGHGLCDYGANYPIDEVEEMLLLLESGEDIVVVGDRVNPSGFLPAVLSFLAHPTPRNACPSWPILRDLSLTEFQRGYLYGLIDARRCESLMDGDDPLQSDEDFLSALLKKGPSAQAADSLRKQLDELGRELLYEISDELIAVSKFFQECAEHPAVKTTDGAFASISFRIAEVFKITGSVGYEMVKGHDEAPHHSHNPKLIEKQVREDKARFQTAAEGLEALQNRVMVFLPCDLDVLCGHYEISPIEELTGSIKLIDDQLSKIQERIYDIGEIARAASKVTEDLPVQKPSEKDLGWLASKTLFTQNIKDAIELAKTERTTQLKGPMVHPKRGEQSQEVIIKHPSHASGSATWGNPNQTAIFTPGGISPKLINGTRIYPWRDHPRSGAEWNQVRLLKPELQEPAIQKSSLPMASGVVMVEPDGRIWMVSPTNKFGGYETTFPKGKLDTKGLTLQANAIKEVYEESGLKVRITGYLGDFKRTTSITRLYLGERVGGDPTEMGWESQAVKLVPQNEWAANLQNPSDQPVLAALLRHFSSE